MAFDIRLPNINGKTDAEQIYQIKRYLYQLAEELKYNLNTLEAGTSDEASVERVGVLDSLDAWKLSVDQANATIKSMVAQSQASISLLVKNGKVSGEILIQAINDESSAKISADRLDIVGKTLDIKVNATNITGQLTAEQIKVTDLSALNATIGGFTIDNNSIHSQMGTSNRILLCSGTSASYKVGDFTSTGWSILAGSNFGVLKDGTMYAQNAHIRGTLTTGDDDFNVTVSDGFVHVKSNAFYDIPTDSGQVYLLMKFDTEDGHTWGLFAGGPYGEGANIELNSLFVKRIDSFGK